VKSSGKRGIKQEKEESRRKGCRLSARKRKRLGEIERDYMENKEKSKMIHLFRRGGGTPRGKKSVV